MTPNYDIKGVPTVFLFGRDKEHPLHYKGRNDQRSVVQFVLTNLNHSYVTLTSPSVALPRFLAEKNEAAALPRIVYFASPTDVDNHEAPVQFVSLALTYVHDAVTPPLWRAPLIAVGPCVRWCVCGVCGETGGRIRRCLGSCEARTSFPRGRPRTESRPCPPWSSSPRSILAVRP
jgi:hypothetical protein